MNLTAVPSAQGDMPVSRCTVCLSKKNIKRCTGCHTVCYCGQKCQMDGWKDYKKECKIAKEEYATVLFKKQFDFTTSFLTEKVDTGNFGKIEPSKSHFLVKVQVPLNKPSLPVLVYNEDRSVMGELWREGNEK